MLANVVALTLAAGCDQSADARSAAPSASVQTDQSQTGMGEPYQLAGTEVWNVPDKLDGRTYQVYVALPPSYDASPNRTYPVLYVTDAHYAFPLIRQFARRMNVDSPVIAEHILVGLAYALGEEGNASRRLDYTPTPTPNRISGGGPAYQAWLKGSVLPFIENKYRADARQRVLLGHSYGGLLAAQVLFSDPETFSGYVWVARPSGTTTTICSAPRLPMPPNMMT